MPGNARRFAVRVETRAGPSPDWSRIIGYYGKPASAMGKVCEVIQQWAASEGAITPNTRLSIVDCNDGGLLLTVQYLGYEPNVFPTGR